MEASLPDQPTLAARSWQPILTVMQTATPQTCSAPSTSRTGSAATVNASWSSNSSTASSLLLTSTPTTFCLKRAARRKGGPFSNENNLTCAENRQDEITGAEETMNVRSGIGLTMMSFILASSCFCQDRPKITSVSHLSVY